MTEFKVLLLAALCILASGCVCTKSPAPAVPRQIKPAAATVQKNIYTDANFSISDEVNTKLRVIFKYINADIDFNNKLAERIAGTAVLPNAELVKSSPYDAVINISSEFETIDSDGKYYRVRCEQVTVAITAPGKFHAIKIIEPADMPRKHGLKNAKNQYLKQVTAAAIPFLQQELAKLSAREIAVSELTFKLANLPQNPRADEIAAQTEKIKNILKNTDGIVNFSISAQNTENASCSFRIVYMKKQFPQGLRNSLNLKLANK